MELTIQQFRRNLQGCVDTLLNVGIARRVPHVDNTDDRQTAAAGHHWTGAIKHILSSLLSDILYTTTWCYLKSFLLWLFFYCTMLRVVSFLLKTSRFVTDPITSCSGYFALAQC